MFCGYFVTFRLLLIEYKCIPNNSRVLGAPCGLDHQNNRQSSGKLRQPKIATEQARPPSCWLIYLNPI
jgi:hypothetical protein